MAESKRKVSWIERSAEIHRNFPSVAQLDWRKAFDLDPQFMGQVVNDLIKSDSAVPGKPGKRPSVDPNEAHAKYRELSNDDYTNLSFNEAFRLLAGNRSVRHLASTLGINRNTVYRIQTSDYVPPTEILVQIARGFKKQPEFFLEYRVRYILGFFDEYFARNPDASMLLMRKLKT